MTEKQDTRGQAAINRITGDLLLSTKNNPRSTVRRRNKQSPRQSILTVNNNAAIHAIHYMYEPLFSDLNYLLKVKVLMNGLDDLIKQDNHELVTDGQLTNHANKIILNYYIKYLKTKKPDIFKTKLRDTTTFGGDFDRPVMYKILFRNMLSDMLYYLEFSEKQREYVMKRILSEAFYGQASPSPTSVKKTKKTKKPKNTKKTKSKSKSIKHTQPYYSYV